MIYLILAAIMFVMSFLIGRHVSKYDVGTSVLYALLITIIMTLVATVGTLISQLTKTTC